MEKISMIDYQKQKIKSPYLSIKFPYKSVNIESQMNNVFLIMSLADATRNPEHIELLMQNLNKAFDLCTSIEDYARVSYALDKAQRLGGIAKEKESDIEKLLNEKERTMLSKMPKDSKVTCAIKEVEGIYSLYNSYQFIPGIKTNNDELKNKSTKYLKQLKFSDSLRTDKMFEKLKGSIRDVIHACINEQEFDEVEQLLSELKNIGGIAVNIYPIASNMNKQAKEHFLEQKKSEEKKAIKEANKTVKSKHELKSQKQESEIIFDESMLEEYYKLKRIAYDAAGCNPYHAHVEKFYEGMNACRKAIDVLDSFKKIAPIELLKKESGIIEELLSTLRRRLFIAEEEEVQRRRNRNR